MAAPCSKLAEAIARIDALVEALKSGKLLGAAASAAAPAPTSAVAAPAAASRPAAAPKPATLAAQPAAAAAPKQAKKEKTKAAKPAAAAAPAAEEDAFAKAQLVVARVTSVSDHPSGSEKLWLCKIDIGGGQERQVVAGLRQHISREELGGRLVAVVLNLKPAKLAGELSEAMILAADHTPEGGDVLVRVLSLPEGCSPGDAIHLEGGAPGTDFPKECKSKFWKEIVSGLAVAAGKPQYRGTPLVTSCGPLTVAADMPDGAGIH